MSYLIVVEVILINLKFNQDEWDGYVRAYNNARRLPKISRVILVLCTLLAISLDPAFAVITGFIGMGLYKHIQFTSMMLQCQNSLAGMITSCAIQMFDEYFELTVTSFTGEIFKHTLRYNSVKSISESEKSINIKGEVQHGLYDFEIPKCFDDMQILVNKILRYSRAF